MPLFHIHGIVAGLLAPLAAGGSIVLSSSIQPTFWSLLEENSITWLTATPTMHKMALELSRPTDSVLKLRFVRSCSAALAPDLQSEIENLYGCPVLQAYAMTEAAHQMTSNTFDLQRPGCVGIASGVELVILNDDDHTVSHGQQGEICVRGPSLMQGYRNNESANASSFVPSGHFRTGDMGMLEADGTLRLCGRSKEMINRVRPMVFSVSPKSKRTDSYCIQGGEKISPAELDEVLCQHESVSEAVAFPIADETYGERVGMAVVPRAGLSVGTKELQEWLKSRIAGYKLPSEVSPSTLTG